MRAVILVLAAAVAGCAAAPSAPSPAELAAKRTANSCAVVAIGADYGQQAVNGGMDRAEFDERLKTFWANMSVERGEKELLARGLEWQYQYGVPGIIPELAAMVALDFCLAGKI